VDVTASAPSVKMSGALQWWIDCFSANWRLRHDVNRQWRPVHRRIAKQAIKELRRLTGRPRKAIPVSPPPPESILETLRRAKDAGMTREQARRLLSVGARKESRANNWPSVELVVTTNEYERELTKVFGPAVRKRSRS
jgi:hypothetical protein